MKGGPQFEKGFGVEQNFVKLSLGRLGNALGNYRTLLHPAIKPIIPLKQPLKHKTGP